MTYFSIADKRSEIFRFCIPGGGGGSAAISAEVVANGVEPFALVNRAKRGICLSSCFDAPVAKVLCGGTLIRIGGQRPLQASGTLVRQTFARPRGSTKVFRTLPDHRFTGLPVPGYEVHRIACTLAVEYLTLLRLASWNLAGQAFNVSARRLSPQGARNSLRSRLRKTGAWRNRLGTLQGESNDQETAQAPFPRMRTSKFGYRPLL